MKLARPANWLVHQWLEEANCDIGLHRDVHLVCRDGTLAWSRLFLASPAVPALMQGLLGIDRCSLCPGTSAAVVLLKDFRYIFVDFLIVFVNVALVIFTLFLLLLCFSSNTVPLL